MSENTTNREATATATDTLTTVSFGVNEFNAKGLAGKPVAHTRNIMGKVLNFDENTNAYLRYADGTEEEITKEDEATTLVPEGASVEFVRSAGRKG